MNLNRAFRPRHKWIVGILAPFMICGAIETDPVLKAAVSGNPKIRSAVKG
jgi:hypothetical protein